MALLTDIKSDSGFVPSGCVFPFAGSSAPTGWLLCDGAEYSTTAYANLFSAISTTYGTQVNPTTGVAWAAPAGGNFRVPDYRSLFLRGTGTNNLAVSNTLGVWKDDATAQNGITVSNPAVTSLGGGEHSHSTSITQNTTGGAIGMYEANPSVDNFTYIRTDTAPDHTHSVTSNVSLTNFGTETRPQSQVVNYIIKI